MATTCAPRFSLSLPLRYRIHGESVWRMASTRNLSSSGVLFRAGETYRPGAEVEVEITLSDAYPVQANKVKATGKVVRQLKDESSAAHWFVAVHFDTYRLDRDDHQVPKFPTPLPAKSPFAPPSPTTITRVLGDTTTAR
jgi:hypothetical protein